MLFYHNNIIDESDFLFFFFGEFGLQVIVLPTL